MTALTAARPGSGSAPEPADGTAAVEQRGQRRDAGTDLAVIGDPRAIERDVQVGAHHDPPAAHLQVLDRPHSHSARLRRRVPFAAGTKVTRGRVAGPYLRPERQGWAGRNTEGHSMTGERRRLEELSPQESMRLLRSVPLGRIVFTARALPAVHPVSHLVFEDRVIVRADSGVAITSALRAEPGTVVAYEADAIDPVDHLGWSVTVVGVAQQVTDPVAADAFRQALRHWADGANDQVISISPGTVTGFRLVAGAAAGAYG
jgi:hypothetical protein